MTHALARQTNSAQVASLSFGLPPIDPLAVLLTLPEVEQHQCYFESPSRGVAIAAWDAVMCEQFSGRDRFHRARQVLTRWQAQVCAFPQRREGPYFFCSFSFFETLQPAIAGFAPATILLTRWQVVRQHGRHALIANVLVQPHTRLHALAREVAQQVHQLASFVPSARTLGSRHWAAGTPWHPRLAVQEGEVFQQGVRDALAAIRARTIEKQVVAQVFDVTRSSPFTRTTALPRLRSQYPDCYIFSFSGKGDRHFIGASPERLLSIHQGRLVTDALAGSAPRGKTPERDRAIGQRLLNTHKEQQEHQLVLDFIIKRLEAEGLTPCYSTPPGLLRLSNIQHLHTPICAEVPSHISPLTLVESLHPTPAVAGVPTQAACERIRQVEAGDRGLYAAPLGWIDPYGNSEFIVGIRSALIHQNHARLYAGAGIVAESEPSQELAEIQLKLQALAQSLG
ncbi:MAG: isochorismate synthase MenF [Leptolyngbyaceae cyanobacterium]